MTRGTFVGEQLLENYAGGYGGPLKMFSNRKSEQIYFDSRSELAICVLLEKYVDGWKAKLRETVQVPISDLCSCDFRVRGVFFEYHPIVIARELGTEFYKDLEKSLKRVPAKEAFETRKALKIDIAKDYWRRRKYMIEKMYGPWEHLVLATEPEEVWHKIMQRFAKDKVSLKKFMEEFHTARKADPIDDYSKKRFKL